MILEAFAERIVRLGAHRSSWRNGISEGSHKPFCSQPFVRAAAYPISFKWRLASRRENALRMLNPSMCYKYYLFLRSAQLLQGINKTEDHNASNSPSNSVTIFRFGQSACSLSGASVCIGITVSGFAFLMTESRSFLEA